MIETLRRDCPAFLASVTGVDEADIALRCGADLIDCKDPSAGALGALDVAVVRDIVVRISKRRPVSATLGDLPADPDLIVTSAAEMAGTGVDIVKVGFFGDADALPAIAALGRLKQHLSANFVAVLMADREPDFSLIPHLADHGFAGVMLDTADKSAGRLTDHIKLNRLREFLRAAGSHGLLAGLAGSLRFEDVAPLASFGPDVLGFRGALCANGRASKLDAERVTALCREIDRVRSVNPAPERSVA